MQQLSDTAQELGLPFGQRTTTYNSRLAQELGLWATDQGKGNQFHLATFRAYFKEGDNLAKHSVLLNIAQMAGLDTEEAAEVLRSRSFKNQVDLDWEASRRDSIRAVPTFVMGSNKLVGAQSYFALEEFIQNNDAQRK